MRWGSHYTKSESLSKMEMKPLESLEITNNYVASKKHLKIAYIGNFLNHGVDLAEYGTGLIFYLSNFEYVDKIDVLAPKKQDTDEEITLKKVKVIELYDLKKPLTLLKILKRVKEETYDLIIINMGPTSFGSSNLANAIGHLLPIYLKRYINKNVKVVYHNSVFTNDVKKLGYNSLYDNIREKILKTFEKVIFKNIDTFTLLDIYKGIINEKLKTNKVKVLRLKYVEAIPVILLNNLAEKESIEIYKNGDTLRVLLHGYWGPQKDLELALHALNNLKEQGFNFHLIISGGINHHFKGYEEYFNRLVEKYKNIINELYQYVPEKDLFKLYSSADLVLLPYNAVGGRSGVLDQAMFFEVPVICINFPEYIEQSKSNKNVVILCNRDEFESAIKNFFMNFKYNQSRIINIKEKISESYRYLENLLRDKNE